MTRPRAALALASAAALSLAAIDAASAACTRLAFSVNDYGKEGPARDARNLLDKYIAKWASERGIKGYKTGPKDVTCELFLDFGFFDEYTCKAAATVCWDGPLPPGHTTEAGATSPFAGGKGSGGGSPARSRPPAASAAPGDSAAPAAPAAAGRPAPITTGSVRAAPPAAPAATPVAPAAPVAAPAAPRAPVAPTAPPAVVMPAPAPAAPAGN